MQQGFEAVHGDAIHGTLTTIDRMIIKGHLMGLYGAGQFQRMLSRQGVLLKDFRQYVLEATASVKARARELAKEAKRPLIWLHDAKKGKDDFARQIAERDGIEEGLICVLSTLEMGFSFDVEGNHETHKLEVVRRWRKCLHLYFYYLDRDFGLMHVRLQTWFPFQIQVYVNGRAWLARQLQGQGVAFQRYENSLLWIEDLARARQLCRRLARRRWVRFLDALARRVNPMLARLRRLIGGYYWVVDQCEIATDVMWKDRVALQAALPDLYDYALRAFSANDVMRFLGRPLRIGFEGEVVSLKGHVPLDLRRRPEGLRVKHRVKRNWIKMYDKWSVLRVETVINNPKEFKVFRPVGIGKRKRRRWAPMRKSVVDLWRYVEVGTKSNERYLEALAQAPLKAAAVAELDSLCRSRTVAGRRYARFNPVSAEDCVVFRAVMAGEYTVQGFRNRNISARIYERPARSPEEVRRRCARTSRQIAKLRAHGLVAKVHTSRLYRVTLRGRRLLAAALRYRVEGFPRVLNAA